MVKKIKKKRLKSLSDVRRYLANLVNETRSGQVDLDMAGKIGYLLNILKSIISEGDLEKRIEQLEEEVRKQ